MRSRNPKYNLRACKCRDARSKKPHDTADRHRSLYELFFSAIWCLAFFFYFRVSLTDRHPDTSVTGSNSLSNEGDNQSAPLRVSDLADDLFSAVEVEELDDQAVMKQANQICGNGYLDLDEFRRITSQGKKVGESTQRVSITHRLDLDGSKYNYASSYRGAKVVSHNREAIGAGNILEKDHDKYLINPCSVLGKFVVIELAEETLVDAIKIANFELHSSNFKEFELLGSLTYPTESWSVLGSFVASNVKQAQMFSLPEPNWARYLNLSLISQYGSEHYCTLSSFEVYGIDAIERMLEDLVVEPVVDDEAGNFVDRVIEVRPKLISSRIPGDSVLKILMQKVRSLELNLTMFERYLRELSKREGYVISHLDNDLQIVSSIVETKRKELKEVLTWKDTMEKETEKMELWKSAINAQMDALISESMNLRFDVENVASTQSSLENREFAVVAINLFFMCVAFLMLVSRRVLTSLRRLRHGNYGIARSSKGWMVILVSSSLTMLIGLLSL